MDHGAGDAGLHDLAHDHPDVERIHDRHRLLAGIAGHRVELADENRSVGGTGGGQLRLNRRKHGGDVRGRLDEQE